MRGKASMEGVHERVDFPATERILELMQEGFESRRGHHARV